MESFTVDGTMLRIGAVIWVERDGQKAIVIGKGGARLRDIGTKARQSMARLFDSKVFLETWVRVRAGWSDDEAARKPLGYEWQGLWRGSRGLGWKRGGWGKCGT